MNRKDLRTAEREWRATKQRSSSPIHRNQLHLGTVLKWVVPAIILFLILTY